MASDNVEVDISTPEPEWSEEWDETIPLIIVLNGDGEMIDTLPVFIWTSPNLIEKEGDESLIITTYDLNNNNCMFALADRPKFTIEVDKECLTK